MNAAELLKMTTPGPWRISAESQRIIKEDFGFVGDAGGCLIASTMGRDDSGFYATEAQAEANARLIAAAPELAARVVELEKALDFFMRGYAGSRSLDEYQGIVQSTAKAVLTGKRGL